MAAPVRYPSGVTNVEPADAMRNLPLPSRTRVHYFFDDFDVFDAYAADATGGGSRWVGGTPADGSHAIIDADGGQIRMTPGTADNSITLIYTQKENFTLEAGRKAWFGIRCACNTEVTEVDLVFGLAETDSSPIATTTANRLVFAKDDGDTNIDIRMTSGGSAVAGTAAIDTLVASTMTTYEFEFDGVQTVHYWIDGALTGSIASASFPTTEMGVVIAIQSGSNSAAANRAVLDVDWVYAAKERTSVND